MLEFTPKDSDTHAAFAALFSLECSVSQLSQMLAYIFDKQSASALYASIESIVKTALHSKKRARVEKSPDITDPATFAVNSALAVIRLECSDPFLVYPYSESHRSYLETPLWQNPGLSQPSQHVRQYYLNTIIEYVFEKNLYPEEAAALLYALRGPMNDLPAKPIRAFADLPLHRIFDARRQFVHFDGDMVQIPETHTSNRCRAPSHQLPSTQTVPPLQRDDFYLYIPSQVYKAKLRQYLFFAFNRLVYLIFNNMKPHVREAIKRNIADIDNRLRKKDETGRAASLYAPLYTVTGNHPRMSGTHRPTVPDPRLVGIVDTIRATPSLEFNRYHSATEIAAAAKEYLSPPHRPSLPRLTTQRIRGTLSHAAQRYGESSGPYTADEKPAYNDVVRTRDTDEAFLIRQPVLTPLYAPTTDDMQHPWDAYKTLLYKQGTESLPDGGSVNPILDYHDPHQSSLIANAISNSHRAAATVPYTERLKAVRPRVTPVMLSAEQQSLTHDEITFLTRVARGMDHLLSDAPLRKGMAQYDTDLSVEPRKLAAEGWLEIHPEPRVTLYTVPKQRRQQLGLQPCQAEGYSDRATEKSLHKYSTAKLYADIASRPDVENTHRYHNLWRLDYTRQTIASIITDSPKIGRDRDNFDAQTLFQSRADVIGIRANTATHIGEAMTTSGRKMAPARNWDKLAVLGQLGATTHWIFPSGRHSSAALRKLIRTNRLDAPETALEEDRSPKECEKFVKKYDPDNPGIDYIHSIQNI